MAIEGVSNVNVNEAGKVAAKAKINPEVQKAIHISEEQKKAPMVNGTADQSKKENVPTQEHIKSAINVANNKIHKTTCEFSYHEETKRVTIKVKDKETDEVIREIPPEETLEMIQKMWELAGILVDERR